MPKNFDECMKPHLWEKGKSGNPSGKRNNTRAIADVIREQMQREIEYRDPFTKVTNTVSIQEAMASKLCHDVTKNGNAYTFKVMAEIVTAQDELREARRNGSPQQEIDELRHRYEVLAGRYKRTASNSGSRGGKGKKKN